MFEMEWITASVIAMYLRMRGDDPERGDIAAWVMLTLMTAGLVVLIFAAFRVKIVEAINHAVDSVTQGTQ